MGKLGIWEILLILLVVLVVFGGKKLSGVGKALGTSIREFKDEMKTEKKDDQKAEETPAADEETKA